MAVAMKKVRKFRFILLLWGSALVCMALFWLLTSTQVYTTNHVFNLVADKESKSKHKYGLYKSQNGETNVISKPKVAQDELIVTSGEKISNGETPDALYRKLLENEHSIWHQRSRIHDMNPVLKTRVKIPYKMIHLDLKGAPPKMKYLTETVLPLVASAGGNSILLEYEDMFPFEDKLANVTHRSHYTKDELLNFLESARKHDLEIIPLVQTFGHLEFVLKLKPFANRREKINYPQEICPSKTESWNLITDLIDQVVNFHKENGAGLNYLHIGCDEVYHMGLCDKCKTKSRNEVFLSHVVRVARYVKTKHNVIPIIWDDMLRGMMLEDIEAYKLGQWAELMVWDYTEHVDNLISPYLWPMYSQSFPNIWIASAFKGAFGETLHTVDIERHAKNQISWLQVLSRETEEKPLNDRIRNFRGVAITGWSRYDHFAVLCELLPAAVPSMLLSLLILQHQNVSTATKEMNKLLKCDSYSELSLSNLKHELENCVWDGKDIYVLSQNLEMKLQETKDFIKSIKYEKGWLTAYNTHYNETSPARIEEVLRDARDHIQSLKTLKSSAKDALETTYSPFVIKEWIFQKFYAVVNELTTIVELADRAHKLRYWHRRPLVAL